MIMKNILKTIKKSTAIFTLFALAIGSFGFSTNQIANAATTWDTTGSYVINMNYMGTDYPHDMSLVQNGIDQVSGNGGSPAGGNVYTWLIDSGFVLNDTIDFWAYYTATPDAVTPQTALHVMGTIAGDGTMSGTWTDTYQGGHREGTFSTVTGTATAKTNPVEGDVMTNPATAITDSDAMLNGTNGNNTAIGHSFWASLNTFSTESPTLPAGVYSTADLGAITANTAFSALLSSTGIPLIAPDTTYYFAAWSNIDGTWYPGEVLNFTTTSTTTPSYVTVTMQKYVDGAMATATSANSTDFPMYATWSATNIGSGEGQYTMSANGYGAQTTPYQVMTDAMTAGASYSTNEITTTEAVGTSCEVEGTQYALVGYTYGDTLEEARNATPSLVAPSFTNMTTDKYVIILNDDCATATSGEIGGQIGGEVIGGNGVLEVTSIEMTDSTSTANNSFEDGWEYVFNVTVPTDETDVSMKFADWMRTGGTETIPAGNNMRISSAQANNGGATIMITAANTYTTPALTMITDLDPTLDGIQVKIIVEVKIPTGTTNGSYTTSYGIKSE